MKIEKLHNNKVIVSMDKEDMNDFNITPDMLKADSSQLQLTLFRIMHDIYKKTGFNPYNGQIIVEASYSNDGGLVFVITKREISASIGQTKAKPDKASIKKIRAAKKSGSKNAIYRFRDFDELCQMLSVMPPHLHHKNSLYSMYNSYFYIVRAHESDNRCKQLMSEFGVSARTHLSAKALKEHGKLIAENAGLVDFACGVQNLS